MSAGSALNSCSDRTVKRRVTQGCRFWRPSRMLASGSDWVERRVLDKVRAVIFSKAHGRRNDSREGMSECEGREGVELMRVA